MNSDGTDKPVYWCSLPKPWWRYDLGYALLMGNSNLTSTCPLCRLFGMRVVCLYYKNTFIGCASKKKNYLMAGESYKTAWIY